MDSAEVEENLFAPGDAKLHGGMCKQLSAIVYKALGIFPVLEDARPRSKSGLQALCSLHVALNKAKSLLLHCSECSKLYLAITGDSILMKFGKARCALQEALRRVEDIVPQAIGCQIMEIVAQLEGTVFTLDPSEKQAGEQVIALLQKEKRFNGNSNDGMELEVFHQAALKLGITSSRAALTERRALKKLTERARAEEDNKKESIVAYLLHLMRKYSKLFRSETPDDTDSQGSAPCSPTGVGSVEVVNRNNQAFERQLTKLSSFNFKQNGVKSGNMPIPPEEFRCPISLQLMYDPVIISSGQTYERVCIEKWFGDGHSTCPKTQQQLSHLCLTPNYCVKGLIAGWCEQNGVPIPDAPPESLDLNYWRLALSEQDATDSRSTGTIDSCQMKGVKVVPLEENAAIEDLSVDESVSLENGPCEDREVDELERYESLLGVLNERNDIGKQQNAVEQVRFLLKDDEEARIYMGTNGFVEALVRFLNSAVCEGDEKAQEVGALALFNLGVNNNRNKKMLLNAGILPLLEEMIQNSETCEAAIALYLNLSCLDEAKPVIGSSKAVPFLIQLLKADNSRSHSCKHDAIYTLFNLSTYAPNITYLLSSGIIEQLQSLLAVPAGPPGYTWGEKALAVFINLSSNTAAKKHIISTAGLIGAIAAVLENGEPIEQEQAVSCLLILCCDDEKCSHLVLQEGIIPALVLVTANGTPRGREKAQRLLKLFREQRQREMSPVRTQPQEVHSAVTIGDGGGEDAYEPTSLSKSRSKRLGRAFTSMASIWKYKNRSRHQY
ncbi:U-box domain-containing protein 45 [Elaeis guineensis]|uniref:RING-type E3 ubiquitin transferase n=2 Tax=Elaeis guineensis var. tenera TaxID=51953 RepID=A0A6I9RQ40_ELAGV|nr:U-box domain-containing protein 6 isoform X1 [Elaeis guineensis]